MGLRDLAHRFRHPQQDEDDDDEQVAQTAEDPDDEDQTVEADPDDEDDADEGVGAEADDEDEGAVQAAPDADEDDEQDETAAAGATVAADEDDDEADASGEIVGITDETAGLNEEQTREELAALYDPNNDMPSDEEEAIKNHDYDVTVRSADHTGEPYELHGKIDTGADANCISEDAAKEHDLDIIPEEPGFETTFKAGDGKKVAPLGQVLLKFSAGQDDQLHTQHFHVVPGMSEDVLLGHPFLERSGAIKFKNKFKDTEDDQDDRAWVKGDEEEPDIDLMALHPPTKSEAAKNKDFGATVKKQQEAKRAARQAGVH